MKFPALLSFFMAAAKDASTNPQGLTDRWRRNDGVPFARRWTPRSATALRPPRVGSLLSLALLLAGCRDATDPEKQRVVGVIDRLGTSPPTVVAPAQITVNQRFIVTVYTWGSSDCTKPDGGSLAMAGEVVRIVPYDIIPIPGHTDVCRDDNAPPAHPFELRLSRAGTTVLRAVGRRASRAEATLDSAEVEVTVAP